MADTIVVSTVDANMVDYPLWLQATGGDAAISYSAADDRELIDAVFTDEGVIGTAAFKVTQRAAGANFSVDITAGRAVIAGDDAAGQRKYIVKTTGVVNAPTPVAPASGTRVHRLVARIRDKLALGSGTYDWTFHLMEDTGSGTPAQPASAITIGLVSITAGQPSVQNSHITDQRPLAQTASSTGLIAETTLTAAVASVSFQSIPQTYKHLMVVCQARSDTAISYTDIGMRFNNDSGANYVRLEVRADLGDTTAGVSSVGSTTALLSSRIPGSLISASHAGGGIVWVRNYSDTNWRDKSIHGFGHGAIASSLSSRVYAGTWDPASPTAVNRLDMFPSAGNFIANSYFAIYGVG